MRGIYDHEWHTLDFTRYFEINVPEYLNRRSELLKSMLMLGATGQQVFTNPEKPLHLVFSFVYVQKLSVFN